jgi:hypothetical protein
VFDTDETRMRGVIYTHPLRVRHGPRSRTNRAGMHRSSALMLGCEPVTFGHPDDCWLGRFLKLRVRMNARFPAGTKRHPA